MCAHTLSSRSAMPAAYPLRDDLRTVLAATDTSSASFVEVMLRVMGHTMMFEEDLGEHFSVDGDEVALLVEG